MFAPPPDKRIKSPERTTRNHKTYCAVFKEESPLTAIAIYDAIYDAIYEVCVGGGAKRDRETTCPKSKRYISCAIHNQMGARVKWAQENGEEAYSSLN